jgi:hypothetical protein
MEAAGEVIGLVVVMNLDKDRYTLIKVLVE